MGGPTGPSASFPGPLTAWRLSFLPRGLGWIARAAHRAQVYLGGGSRVHSTHPPGRSRAPVPPGEPRRSRVSPLRYASASDRAGQIGVRTLAVAGGPRSGSGTRRRSSGRSHPRFAGSSRAVSRVAPPAHPPARSPPSHETCSVGASVSTRRSGRSVPARSGAIIPAPPGRILPPPHASEALQGLVDCPSRCVPSTDLPSCGRGV